MPSKNHGVIGEIDETAQITNRFAFRKHQPASQLASFLEGGVELKQIYYLHIRE